jgi:FkbM family methyltransferase
VETLNADQVYPAEILLRTSAGRQLKTVWNRVNQVLKEKAPGVRRVAKRLAAPWLQADTKICVPKRLAGRLIWTQPRLLMSDMPEEHILRWTAEALRRGGTFFDVGAHYGWISMAAAQRVGRSGRVVSFEPSPVLVDILRYHQRVNRLGQMQIVQAAVSNQDQEQSPFFLINEGLSFRNSLTIGGSDVPYVCPENKTRATVRSLTLDGFTSSSGIVPNVIKIDVEGAEWLVLEGARRLLAEHHPDLIVGVHPFWLPASQSVDRILSFLEQLGYRVTQTHKVEFEDTYIADYFCTYRGTPR